jgi:hypothetical protein
MDDQPKFGKIAQFYERERNTGEWKQKWGKLWDGTEIYVVSGPYIRAHFYVDFVEGGHGYVYKWIPKDEIWIEDMEDNIDEALNLSHEIYEYTLMKYVSTKKEYDKAHECSANFEGLVREAMTGAASLRGGKQKKE